ncbi:acetyl-CoA synthetase [Salinibacter ruber]|uniref:acetate--CoA ligase n=1 Tax=Salinibacter ruber TaxID=146919 RepID=A0AAW5P9L0_9BACT|nr:AMP-binding protein [Salinibacter ruber]MCS3664053.1 acetyl-CoA synthetase [Salinibacter ruber]MCS3829602.1 acetyl-CoA synthetase [Salinibacter ruber]MCS4056202.1 acetyl-CoA synthetase [Salinibacter ruber]MCS4060023.1 acetyl-CoA synthetase [Salinibacter ruber]MCS4134941.1 acetyl-CoA synthetase [Salinibacter ruber]
MSTDMSPAPNSFPFGQDVVWTPDPDVVADSNLRRFIDRHDLADLSALRTRAASDVAWFWEAVLDDLDIEFYDPYDQIVDLSGGIERPAWCVNGSMNIVHNLLDKWQGTPAEDRTALRWEGEDGATRTLTYGELHRRVCRCANALRDLGLGRGDRIGLFMPMTPEIVIAFLAIAKIGGVLLPLFSGYGVGALVTRLQGAEADALFTADGFARRGRPIDMKETADEAVAQCPTVEHVIVHRHLGRDDTPMTTGRDRFWADFVAGHDPEAHTARTGADDPVMVIYTSGTTGPPKGTVHTHCGFPIKGAQDMYHPMDLKPGETMYWMSDMGWMMGPWLVFGTLTVGATMVLYDGAPDHPDAGRLWQLVDDHEVTHLGVSPTLIRALKTHGDAPVRASDRSSLRAIGSTGSPWDPESWSWCFETVLDGEKPILNYSGGTEIAGGILCGNFLEPLKPAAFSGPVPGMDADVVDEDGTPVREEVGELVLRAPWIGMTRGFWGDDDRYHDAYWDRLDDVWVHGDFAAVDEDGLWYILGRSDDTINVAGKRLGPAEIEALLNAHGAVAESAAIGVPHDVKGSEIVAFVVLEPDHDETAALREELMQGVVDEMGKPLKPREIRFADALPKTRNAKVMRRVIRAAYLGEELGDTSSLEDPGTVDAIQEAR